MTARLISGWMPRWLQNGQRPWGRMEPLLRLFWLAFLWLPTGAGSAWESRASLLATGFALLMFLGLYRLGCDRDGPRYGAAVAGIFLLACGLLPWNAYAFTLFIYAGTLSRYAQPRHLARSLFAVVAGVLLLMALQVLPWPTGLLTLALLMVIGGSMLAEALINRHRAELQAKDRELAQLATHAERERIAHDLHDLLGHSLSLVAIKAELAGKLLATQPALAANELSDIGRVARQSLADVRQTIGQLRQQSLEQACRQVRGLLEAAGVHMDMTGQMPAGLSPEQELVLGFCIIEAGTNVVRHAQASNVHLSFATQGEQLLMSLSDNGIGCAALQTGTGLQGMQKRLESLGGGLQIDAHNGTCIRIRLPLIDQGTST